MFGRSKLFGEYIGELSRGGNPVELNFVPLNKIVYKIKRSLEIVGLFTGCIVGGNKDRRLIIPEYLMSSDGIDIVQDNLQIGQMLSCNRQRHVLGGTGGHGNNVLAFGAPCNWVTLMLQ
jgi:hypothetical protein